MKVHLIFLRIMSKNSSLWSAKFIEFGLELGVLIDQNFPRSLLFLICWVSETDMVILEEVFERGLIFSQRDFFPIDSFKERVSF